MPTRYLPLVFLSVIGILGAEPKRDRFGDPLPDGAFAGLGSLRLRSEPPISSAVFMDNGKTLATVGIYDRYIRVWDRDTGKEVRRVELPPTPGAGRLSAYPLFTADGKTVILCMWDHTIRFLDTASGVEKRKLSFPQHGHVDDVALSRDGTTLAALHEGTVVVWDVSSGKPRCEIKGLDKVLIPPWSLLALTPDGKRLVVPHADGSARLVDTTSGKEIRAFKAEPDRTRDVRNPLPVISPDGRYLALGYDSPHRVLLHDLATGKTVREWTAFVAGMDGLAFTPDSRFFVRSNFPMVELVSVLSGKATRELLVPEESRRMLVVSPDGQTLATCRNGCIIDLWDMASGRSLHSHVGHVSAVKSIVFFPDGERLASCDPSGSILVWGIPSARVLAHRDDDRMAHLITNPLAVEEDGKTLRYLSFQFGGGEIHRWNPDANRKILRQKLPINSFWFELSANGRTLAARMSDKMSQAQLHDLQGGKAARTIAVPNAVSIERMLISPNGRLLLTVSSNFKLHLWDGETGTLVRQIQEDASRQYTSSAPYIFSGDSRSLAYVDSHIRIREIASGEQRLQIPLPLAVGVLAYSPDGRFLACDQYSGAVLLFSTATGKQLAQWHGRQGGILSLAFSRDSRLLASGGGNGSILLWKVPKDESLPTTLKAVEAGVLWQALASDDAAHAHRALARLAAAPGQAVPLIRERLATEWKKPDAERLAQWIAELDDDAFKVRERAARELAEADSDAAAALRQALANHPSLEARIRMEELLNRLQKSVTPRRLRAQRAVEVLERIGSPAAKDVLRSLTGKSLPVDLREEVQATLRRLGNKP